MNKEVSHSLAWAVGIVVVGLGASLARQRGYIDEDTTKRLVMAPTGLMVAAFGNRAPKRFVPDIRARQATRVAGWSLALSGLVYAGLWAFAPLSLALWGGCGAVVLGIAVTVVYCLSLRGPAKAT
jgi:hypothetical protein